MDEEHDTGLMSHFEKEAHSFVIRIWKENREGEVVTDPVTSLWRGWIRHVQSDRQYHFTDTAEISRIVALYTSHDAELDNLFEPIQKGTAHGR
ncbi:MAG: hypothetical protein HC804_13480 [Anaerolineae bacterium]|nr:hypothetical protein [Anaerolineae bacterium]